MSCENSEKTRRDWSDDESDDTQYSKFERRLLTQDADRFIESCTQKPVRPPFPSIHSSSSFNEDSSVNGVEENDLEVSREFEVLSLENVECDEKVPAMVQPLIHDNGDVDGMILSPPDDFIATQLRKKKMKVETKNAGNYTKEESTSACGSHKFLTKPENKKNRTKPTEAQRIAAFERQIYMEYGVQNVVKTLRTCKVATYKSVGVQTMVSSLNLNWKNGVYVSNQRNIDALCLEAPKTNNSLVKPFCVCKAKDDIFLRTCVNMHKRRGTVRYGGQAEKPRVRVGLSRRGKVKPLHKTVVQQIMMSSRNGSE